VRPLDAEGALAYLIKRKDVQTQRVMLQGWSNGGSTTLNVMYRQTQADSGKPRFRGALAFYPGCGPQALLTRSYQVDAPLWVFLASEDEEVSPKICRSLLSKAPNTPARVDITEYEGATHDFDDPGRNRQDIAANRSAKDDALKRAANLLGALR